MPPEPAFTTLIVDAASVLRGYAAHTGGHAH
jgi:hypothetical protein